ncbi:hypothetical protein A6R68_04698 [Neotoma lepida]|uniref:Uncharacterized protein n=1 Tax=Neotoma lepida TaxID=56216 RepID=A0A1A6GN40_NEOLE|nr:hypothetical protein A6R68_04698 [Neotoma lepida]
MYDKTRKDSPENRRKKAGSHDFLGPKRHTGYLNSLKDDSRNITYSVTIWTKSSDQNFMVFLNEVQAAITGHKHCHLLAILDELHPDTPPDSRIWLFDFSLYFFQHNPLCMRSTISEVSFPAIPGDKNHRHAEIQDQGLPAATACTIYYVDSQTSVFWN